MIHSLKADTAGSRFPPGALTKFSQESYLNNLASLHTRRPRIYGPLTGSQAALDKNGKRYYNGNDKCDEGNKSRMRVLQRAAVC